MKPEASFNTLLLDKSVYSETSFRFYETAQHCIPQDVILPETYPRSVWFQGTPYLGQ
jgi:hypothetical protein